MAQDSFKECPYCCETILASAKKCKHCKEIVDVVFERSQHNSNVQHSSSGKGWAVTSMIIGIIGLFTFNFMFLIGLLAIIFGCVAKDSMKKSDDYDGSGMATTGIVLGCIEIASGVILIFIWAGLFGFLASQS